MQSLEEILADKLIALAYRARRIKPRDVWDIVWIKQRAVKLSHDLLNKKLDARNKGFSDFQEALKIQLNKLHTSDEVKLDFIQEMKRFVPSQVKQRTIENPDFWVYVQDEVADVSKSIFTNKEPGPELDFGM